MPSAARGANAKAKAQGRGASTRRSGRTAGRAAAARRQPLEHRILLTATLCLLAFGAVMVYSASSATALLEGSGTGSAYLVKFVIFGAVGLGLMQHLARHGIAKAQDLVGPLLAV